MTEATAVPFLSLQGVGKRFGGLAAVNDVSFEVARGEVVSIIGPNGAGKTTLFNLLTGQLAPSGGEIRFGGELINSLPPNRRAKLGLGRTFQVTKPLVALTVLENVMVGAFLHHRATRDAETLAMQVLGEIGLAHRAAVRAGELTLAERRKLEVGRAMAMEPRVVLLDEVMAGLNQSEVDDMITLIQSLALRGLTLLIIEHNLKVVRAFAKRVIVMDRGRKIAEGPAEQILSAPEVVTAYLGKRRQ